MFARKFFEDKLTHLLGRLKFDDEVLEWVREALDASHADERRGCVRHWTPATPTSPACPIGLQ